MRNIQKNAEKGNFRIASLTESIYSVIIRKVGFKVLVLTTTLTNGEITKWKVEMAKI